jgi:2-keto-4-pentenoate hydratase/2-oxohepta-3-ene-1,7-dioic acid hydratase in catechol pathway
VVKTGLVEHDTVTAVGWSWSTALGLLADGATDRLLTKPLGPAEPLASVTLLAPLEGDGDVYCVGLNYLEHQWEAAELVDGPTEEPIIFAKSRRAMADPHAVLMLPEATSSEFDWETELGVVIGRDGTGIAASDAWAHVAGYCVVNDVTARDLQTRHKQWHLGKNVLASTPIGPWVAERDSLPIPPDVELSLSVNGVEKQRGRSSQLIHSIPALIELLSSVMSLRVGDIIATGTPSGVGFKRQPPEFLCDGDVMETTVTGVGTLTNVVRTATRQTAGEAGRTAELV